MTGKMGKALVASALIGGLATLAGVIFLFWEAPASEYGEQAARQVGEAVAALPSRREPQARPEAVSLSDCLDALAKPSGSSQLMAKRKRLEIEGFLRERGNALEQALAADIAGYQAGTERIAADGLPARLFWRYGAPAPPRGRELSPEERRQLEGALASDRIDELIASGGPALLRARWGDTTLAGHLVRAGQAERLAALQESGVGLHELALAIAEGVAPETFVALLDGSGVDPAASWWNGANLAKVAAIRRRPDILRILIARGAAPAAEPRWGVGGALDDLAATATPEGERFADVARQLIAAGDQPRLPSTLATLRRALPEARLPALRPEAAAASRSAAVTETAKALAALDAEWTRKVDAAARLERRCEPALAASATTDAETFIGTDLAAKRRHQQVLEQRRERWMEALRVTTARSVGTSSSNDSGNPALAQALEEAMATGHWDGVIALVDELGGDAPSAMLMVALHAKGPLDAIVALLERGAPLPADAALQLAQGINGDAAEIAQGLESYGLDLHHVDAFGRNALRILAARNPEDENAWRFAKFLASRGVTPKPRPFGLDPLDAVLARLLEHPHTTTSAPSIRFARLLLDHGAPVEPSHLRLAALIATANAGVYQQLTRLVPELAS